MNAIYHFGALAVVFAVAWAIRWKVGPINRASERRPSNDHYYCLISFDQADEASAFLAALSRFSVTPAGLASAADADALEVWSAPRHHGMDLFLSDGAYHVAKVAFSLLPATHTVRGKEIPRDATLPLVGFSAPPKGVDPAAQRLK